MAPIRIPILTYHTLDERRSMISVAPSVFEWQMRWLYERGYKAILLSELARQLRAGKLPLERTVVITFDDGFATVYSTALPLLTRYRFAATVFVIPGHCGGTNDWPGQPASVPRQPLLTWPQVRELHRYGLEFGAHTLTHPRLDRLGLAQLRAEILDSKAVVEDHLGDAVEVFAYPFGNYTDTARAIVAEAYVGACTTHLSLVEPMSDPLQLGRVEILYLTSRPVFARMSDRWFPWYLGLRRAFRTASSIIFKQPWK